MRRRDCCLGVVQAYHSLGAFVEKKTHGDAPESQHHAKDIDTVLFRNAKHKQQGIERHMIVLRHTYVVKQDIRGMVRSRSTNGTTLWNHRSVLCLKLSGYLFTRQMQ